MRTALAFLAIILFYGCTVPCPGCDDGNICTSDNCSGGMCVHQPLTGKLGACDCMDGRCVISASTDTAGGDYVERQYNWTFSGAEYSYNVSLSGEWYGYYKAKTRERSYDLFVSDPHSRTVIGDLVRGFDEYADERGFNDRERLNFVVAFVQGLPYTPDNVSTPFDNYPRYAFETLYDDGGDCEDASILMAGILQQMGYKVVLLLLPDPPGHMAVGVECNATSLGYAVAPVGYEGKEYCYVETTGTGYMVGEIPAEFEGKNYQVLPLSPRAELDVAFNASYVYTSKTAQVDVDVNVTNVGSADAKDVTLRVELDADNGTTLNSYTFEKTDITPDSVKIFSVRELKLPAREPFRIRVTANGTDFDNTDTRSELITSD